MMNKIGSWIRPAVAILAIVSMAAFATADGRAAPKKKTWSIKADYIEACSCNLFCQCYFATHPEGEFCEFNNAVQIREAHVGDVKLDGKKFWLSGDLGNDFSKGEMKSAVMTFEPGTTKEEKDAIAFLVGKIYPVKWGKVVMDEAPITWQRDGNNGYAKLGDKGEVKLTGVKGDDGKLAVIHNLKYWGADKNSGFELAHSTHHYKGNGFDYDETDKNGFFISIESSGDM
jgi:hypothetical protein